MNPKIVLTADETMMSKYSGGIFVGFATCMPSGIIPDWIFFKFIAPPVPRKNGKALQADYGMRIVEAVLKKEFGEDSVAIVHPKDLEKVVGEETEVIGITGHDYLGICPPTSEFADLCPTGEPLNRKKFLELMSKDVMRKKIVIAGGKGAWQLANEEIMKKLNIDYVFLGEAEITLPKVVKEILEGEEVPRIIYGEEPEVDQIPTIRGATIHGVVEISRGCGRGCKFCSPTMQRFRCKRIDQILKDIEVNLKNGQKSICFHSEDVLRYGAKGLNVNADKLKKLFIKTVKMGVKNLGFSHAALATVYHNPSIIKELSEIVFSNLEQKWIGFQTGIETGSPKLIRMHMRGKAAPSPPEKWPEIVKESIGILNDYNWIPAATMINGLPGEDVDDVLKSIELVEELKGYTLLVVPMNFVAMKGTMLDREESFTRDKMLPEHWILTGLCIEHDLKVADKLLSSYVKGIKNYPVKFIFKRLMKGVSKYVKKMKNGEPPMDYSNAGSHFYPKMFLNLNVK